MTIVVSHRHRIHFVVEGERGAFLILHHGLFGSHRDWFQAGYVDALRDDFRLIIPDARGHGRSDDPARPEAFRLDELSDDLVAVLNELDIRNAHFVGYSLGALVGFDLISRHPERVRLIMLGGEAPVVTEEATTSWRTWGGEIEAQGFAAWARAQCDASRLAVVSTPGGERQEAAGLMLRAMAGWEVSRAETYQVNSPITIFTASADPAAERIQRVARQFQRARFISFSGHSHRSLFEQRETLLDGILRFIRITRRPEGALPFARREGGGRERVREAPPQEAAAAAPEEPREEAGEELAAKQEARPAVLPAAPNDEPPSADDLDSLRADEVESVPESRTPAESPAARPGDSEED